MIPLLHKALELEEVDPKTALAYYNRLSKENKHVYLDFLFVSIFFPVIAMIISYCILLSGPRYPNLIAFIIIAVIGYGPGLILLERRELEKTFQRLGWYRKKYESRRRSNRWIFFLSLLAYAFFYNIFVLILVLVGAAFIAAPLKFIASLLLQVSFKELPIYIGLPIEIFAAVFSLAFFFSRIKPKLFPLKKFFQSTFIDLKLGMNAILSFLAEIGKSAVLVGVGPLGLLYEHPDEGIVASAVTGLFFGLAFYRPERDIVFGNLIRLGQARCLLRLSRNIEATYRTNEVKDFGGNEALTEVNDLAEIMSNIIEDKRKKYIELLNDLYQSVKNDYSSSRMNALLLQASIYQTIALAGIDIPKSELTANSNNLA